MEQTCVIDNIEAQSTCQVSNTKLSPIQWNHILKHTARKNRRFTLVNPRKCSASSANGSESGDERSSHTDSKICEKEDFIDSCHEATEIIDTDATCVASKLFTTTTTTSAVPDADCDISVTSEFISDNLPKVTGSKRSTEFNVGTYPVREVYTIMPNKMKFLNYKVKMNKYPVKKNRKVHVRSAASVSDGVKKMDVDSKDSMAVDINDADVTDVDTILIDDNFDKTETPFDHLFSFNNHSTSVLIDEDFEDNMIVPQSHPDGLDSAAEIQNISPSSLIKEPTKECVSEGHLKESHHQKNSSKSNDSLLSVSDAKVKPSKYNCDECSYTCNRKISLNIHKAKHTGLHPYKCMHCDFTSIHSSSLRRHTRIHTGERPYKCPMCDYSTIDASTLRIHTNKHTGEEPYRCSECNYCCSQSTKLKIHMRKHSGERPYTCSECGFTCSYANSFKRHVMQHNGERPYKCSKCDYSSCYLAALRFHEFKHVEKQPYPCPECEYKTCQMSKLKVHMRKHTGEQPYKCTLCDFLTSYDNALKRHMHTHRRSLTNI